MHFSNWQNKFTALWLDCTERDCHRAGYAWLKKDIHIQTNIFALLPEAHHDPRLERAQQYVSQQLNDKVFVVLNAKDDAALSKATATFKQSVAATDLWQPLHAQLDSDRFAQVLYQHRRSAVIRGSKAARAKRLCRAERTGPVADR